MARPKESRRRIASAAADTPRADASSTAEEAFAFKRRWGRLRDGKSSANSWMTACPETNRGRYTVWATFPAAIRAGLSIVSFSGRWLPPWGESYAP